MKNNQSGLAEYSASIDKVVNNAGNYAKFSILLEFIKSSCEMFCSKKSKDEAISKDDIKTFKEKLKQLDDLSNQIIDS